MSSLRVMSLVPNIHGLLYTNVFLRNDWLLKKPSTYIEGRGMAEGLQLYIRCSRYGLSSVRNRCLTYLFYQFLVTIACEALRYVNLSNWSINISVVGSSESDVLHKTVMSIGFLKNPPLIHTA